MLVNGKGIEGAYFVKHFKFHFSIIYDKKVIVTKVKFILILTAVLVCKLTSNGQNVRLCYDTINVFTILQVDQRAKLVYAETRYFYMGGRYYYANNFPFDQFKANCGFSGSEHMFYTDYKEIINRSSIKHLKSVLNSLLFYNYNDTNHVFSPEVSEIIACIGKEVGGHLMISERKIIAAYFLIDCRTRTGVDDVIYCDQEVDLSKTPVILNVVKFLE